MPLLPAAVLSVSEQSNPLASGAGYLALLACVAQNATATPAVYTSAQALLNVFGYAPGIDYAALHFQQANKPILFCPLPIATAGAVVTQNNAGVTGTSQVSATVGANGAMEAVQGVMTVVTGTNVGTDQIRVNLSLDNGVTVNLVRIGTATSYVIPYVGVTLNFGSGTLNPGDVFTFVTTAPTWNNAGIQATLAALQAQQNTTRTWLVVGEAATSTLAGNVRDAANTYASQSERFTVARVQTTDYQPLPTKSQTQVAMTGAPTITFSGTAHTITRSTGSFITDGFTTGMMIKVAGATAGGDNGVFGPVTVTSATVLTLTSGLVTEGPDTAGAVTIVGSDELVFAATSITRSIGSWLTEGFAVGQTVAITGATAPGNNTTAVITGLSATVLTATGSAFTAENDFSASVGVVQVLTDSQWIASQTAAFASIDASPRINLGYGRGRIASPITGYTWRRGAQWFASLREYQHDVQIPTYRKFDGPLTGCSLTDTNGNTVEHDERVNGGALAGRFTCLRSYANGPLGAFVALDLTRDTEGNLLSRMQNEEVTNKACAIVQASTENAIGTVLQLQSNGTATTASLGQLQEKINTALQNGLLQQFSEGPNASSAQWVANTTDNLSVPGATLNGVLNLIINGTLEQINTSVVVT
jgi:hypothetical protein